MSRLVTKADILYYAAPYGFISTIPEGTPVIPATNLPGDGQGQYWAESWPNMSERAEAWKRNYGFLIKEFQVEEVL